MQRQWDKLVTIVQFTNNDYDFLTYTGPYSKFWGEREISVQMSPNYCVVDSLVDRWPMDAPRLRTKSCFQIVG